MINAGKYNRRIKIVLPTKAKDKDGFPTDSEPVVVLEPWASIKTTRGFTLIVNNTDFDKAFTNFTIRYPVTQITRDMLILYGGKTYEIQYLNNINEACIELEIQAKEVTH
jgi:SPP1 family predicted phage head-tail adaptor